MRRRQALKYIAVGAALTCPSCLSIATALASGKSGESHAGGHSASWGYEGNGAPENWQDLSPANRVCGVGFQQSPIDIGHSIPAETGKLDISYKSTPLRILNNGHTVQVNCDAGSSVTLDGKAFKLLQFHFHHPSEHTLRGRAFDLEAHFVHVSNDGVLAVLGVFVAQGADNGALAPIWDNIPASAGPEKRVASITVFPERLLPSDRTYYRYYGSLTTPPCSEKVIWSVFQTPLEASSDQVKKFASIYPTNARPTQALNRRFLLRSK